LAHKKSSDILISDLLVNKNLCKIKFDTRKVKVELESEITVKCDACDFTEHELIMCLELKKILVCLKNKPSNTELSFFDKGNFLFVIFLGYMDFAYKIPEFISDGYIEILWSSHLRDVDFNKIISQIRDCCDSNNNIKP
ncbi:130_t:CDS:2, partial [Cetraspora pellucida]